MAERCMDCGHRTDIHTRRPGEPGDCLSKNPDTGRRDCPCETLQEDDDE